MYRWEENFPNQGDIHWNWASSYVKEVKDALIAVIREHGAGQDGWKTVRWEVYDKYSDCVEGLFYYSDGRDKWWIDGASHWLRDELPKT